MEYPRLIETNVRNYIQTSLESCHTHRIRLYSIAFNIGVLLLFIIIGGLALYYCYNKKETPYEKRQKMLRDQEYILSKIRYYQHTQKERTSSYITQLPGM